MAALGPRRYVRQHIQRHMYDNTRFNLVKLAKQKLILLTVRRSVVENSGQELI